MSEKEVVNKETGEMITAITPVPVQAEVIAYNPDDPSSIYLNRSIFDQLKVVAKMMADSELVPAHLRNKPADCFLVCSQAIRWKMDPFAAAQHIYVAKGKVGWEGKIVAAIVNSKLHKKLSYEYKGDENTPGRAVQVSGTLRGETKPRTVKGSIKEWSTGNEQWKSGDQMLSYRGAREWARRHMPEAVLGVYSDDEVREIAIKKAEESSSDALDDILDPAKVTSQDDPPEMVRSTRAEVPPEEEQPASQAKAKAERKRAAAKKKVAPKKEEAVKVYESGDVLASGRIVQEVDEDGQPTVVTTPKALAKAAVKKTEPPVAADDQPPSDDEIDALFS